LADAADLKTPPTLPTTQLIERFIASRRDGLSPRTIEKCYRLYLKRSIEVVGLHVIGEEIQRFISSRPCSGGGKHAYFRCLRAFYNWLYSPKSGLGLNVQNNPILAVDAPKVEKKILLSLTPEQLDYLIGQTKCIRDKAIISLFADSGLRLAELANIKLGNIDWQSRLIKLQERRNDDGRLWDIRYSGISWMMQLLKHKTGLPCNPHTFRRTFASILAKRGLDSLHIMRLGRWESMAMVERYTRSVRFEDSLKFYKAQPASA